MQAVQGGQGGGSGALHMGGGSQGGLYLDQPVLVRLPARVYGPLLNGLHCNSPVGKENPMLLGVTTGTFFTMEVAWAIDQ